MSRSVPHPVLQRTCDFLHRADCDLYYEVTGRGPALLFAYGLGGNHLSWWQQVAFFAERYTCVTFAHRGFSPSRLQPRPPEPAAYADDLGALIDHLGLDKETLRDKLAAARTQPPAAVGRLRMPVLLIVGEEDVVFPPVDTGRCYFCCILLGCAIMPRGPRLDAPGVLHHVMVRGIEGRPVFRDDRDRDDFCRRLSALVTATGLAVYAWALLPNHAHLLVRTGRRPLARVMRSLLTGYAGAFNRRHRRRGHLFQNRYKSIVIEEEPYFLELVRYLHLNPIRAKVVETLQALAAYRYCGHGALLGRQTWPWQDTDDVLARFGTKLRQARTRYLAFVADGVAQGRRHDLQGGGLVRSAGGWAAVRALRRGREGYTSDERILGGSAFVEALQREVEATQRRPRSPVMLESLIRAVCRAEGTVPGAVQGSGRSPALCRAREGIAYLWIEVLGRSGRQLTEVLGVSPPSIYRACRRGHEASSRWRRVLPGEGNAP